MKDTKVLVEFDVSTPEGINYYNLAYKIPLIFEGVQEFKSVLNERFEISEIKEYLESNDINSAINKERKLLTDKLIAIFTARGISI